MFDFDRTSRFKSQVVRLMILEFVPDVLLLAAVIAVTVILI